VKPRFAFVASPVWDRAQAEVREGLAELAGTLGDRAEGVELPEAFERAHDWHRAIMLADIARNYARYIEMDAAGLSSKLMSMIEEGLAVKAVDYANAQDSIAPLNVALEKLFERYDAIVTPAAPGEAPAGLESTGDPVFSTLWTYCGVPALTVPLLSGPNGMPVGVQLVGRPFYDGRLLRTARWLCAAVAETRQVRGFSEEAVA
jgi:Asp-tRNA(Asn)/Glu-tRNA(Gln) amidotransferase A subunit family amidase